MFVFEGLTCQIQSLAMNLALHGILLQGKFKNLLKNLMIIVNLKIKILFIKYMRNKIMTLKE